MRYLNLPFGLAMLGFTGVQYNDPDGLLWMVYYLIPAAWAFLAAFRLDMLRGGTASRLLRASVGVWLGLMIFYWPGMPNFWQKEVFMAEETAREGMGMMIAWLVVVVAAVTALVNKPTVGQTLSKAA